MSTFIKAGITAAVVLGTTAIVLNVRETKHRKAGEKALQDRLSQLPKDILESAGIALKASTPKKEDIKEEVKTPKTETTQAEKA